MFRPTKFWKYILPAFAVGTIALFAYGIYHTVYAFKNVDQTQSANCVLVSNAATDTICALTGSACDPEACSACNSCSTIQTSEQVQTATMPTVQIDAAD